MNDSIDHKRRKILQYAGVGALAATALPSLLRASDKQPGRKASADFHPDVDIDLTARTAHMSLFSGLAPTPWYMAITRSSSTSVVPE